MTHYVIIVAGGSGSRMKNDTPKQFLQLQGKPLLMHTIHAFHQSKRKPEIILVLKESTRPMWEALCREHHFTIPHRIVAGGSTRFHSVKNGLQTILTSEIETTDTVIAIHDGVRPLVSNQLIEQSFALAEEKKSAIPTIQCQDSVRIKQATGTYKALPREGIFLIQTPQVFNAQYLKTAFEQEYQDIFTDDATVVEYSGYPLHFMGGDIQNIKITHPNDLVLAEHWLSLKNA